MDGKKRKWKTRKAGGLTGRHTLVLAHKSSGDPFFTFPECDARERNSRPARLPAGNRNHVLRQKTAALWYTSLFGNVSSLGSPVIISKYGTHFYFNLRRIIPTSPINPFDLSFLLLFLLVDYLRVSFLSPPPIFVKFFRRKVQNTPLILVASSFQFSQNSFGKNGKRFYTLWRFSWSRREKIEFSSFRTFNFRKVETLDPLNTNNEEERSNSRRTFNFPKK